MLRLTRLADYAFAVLRHLASAPGAAASAREIADATDLPLPTVSKLLKQLAQSRMVKAQRGPRGGYQLAQPADQIKVADVIAAIDGPVSLTECASHAEDCTRARHCELRPNFLNINATIRRVLHGISLEDLGRPPGTRHAHAPAASDDRRS